MKYSLSSLQEALLPRAARNIKSYAEVNHLDQPERTNKRRKKESEPQEKVSKRRKAEYSVPSATVIEGAAVQVRGWSYGNLSKRDALRFSRAVGPTLYGSCFQGYLKISCLT